MFGFGKGKIEIQLDKYNYSPGETIQGNITLDLKKQLKARGVFVTLYGEKKVRQMSSTTQGTSIQRVFEFKQPLDKAGEYPPTLKNYTFHIKIPSNILSGQAPEGVLGNIVKAAQFLGGSSAMIQWYIDARIDIPMGIDVSRRVQINIA